MDSFGCKDTLFRKCIRRKMEIVCDKKSCVLPCCIHPGNDRTLHWSKTEEDLNVHSYYDGRSQFWDQHPDYIGRTSLFENDISAGNASLQLSDVTPKDQGRYLCFSGCDRNSLTLKVIARAMRANVSLVDEELLCQAFDIYPEPEVKWDPEPLEKPRTFTKKSKDGLYSVSSYVPRPLTDTFQYSCNVSNEHSWDIATYEQKGAPPQPGWIIPGLLSLGFVVVAAFSSWLFFLRRRKHKGILGKKSESTADGGSEGSSNT